MPVRRRRHAPDPRPPSPLVVVAMRGLVARLDEELKVACHLPRDESPESEAERSRQIRRLSCVIADVYAVGSEHGLTDAETAAWVRAESQMHAPLGDG